MIRTWFVPAWNGDWRLEASSDEKQTVLTIERPTASEKRILGKLAERFVEKTWIDKKAAAKMKDPSRIVKTRLTLGAPLTEVGPYVSSVLKPGRNVLTAVRFRGGKIEVSETSTAELDVDPPSEQPATPCRDSVQKKKAEEVAPAPKHADTPSPEAIALAKKPDAEAAATVKRPTPCCPNCFTDLGEVNKPATECLLAFLSAEEHEMWARERYVIVRGGITGHRYRIAHRNSPIAEKQTRLCWDLDDDALMHFHDWLVPPEEEVLATMLILKHREPWLRNEATAFGGRPHVFKNPFGDGGDGLEDSSWTYGVGHALQKLLGIEQRPHPMRATPGAILSNEDGSLYSEDGYDA